MQLTLFMIQQLMEDIKKRLADGVSIVQMAPNMEFALKIMKQQMIMR